MIVVRLLGLFLIVIALMLFGADVVSAVEGGSGFSTRSLDHILALFMAGTPTSWIESSLPPSLASLVTIPLRLPAWLSTGIVGFLLALIASGGRKWVFA